MSTAAVRARGSHPAGPRVARLGIPSGPWITIVSLGSGIIAWEIVARLWQVPFFPPFSRVVERLVELTLDGLILASLANSLVNLAIGFLVAVTVGVGTGMLMGAYRKVDMALEAYVYALLTAPSLVFAPIFFAMFGLSRIPVIAVIVMYSMFIIILNTAAAIRNVSPALIEMGRSFCASDRQLFFKIILPAALPLTMAGIRLGMARAVKGMVNGEMFIAAVGLGAVIMNAGRRFDAAAVLAVLLVTVGVALLMVKAVQVVDVRLTGWLPSTQRARLRR
jgi:NitT/TauT family transport system permease protein